MRAPLSSKSGARDREGLEHGGRHRRWLPSRRLRCGFLVAGSLLALAARVTAADPNPAGPNPADDLVGTASEPLDQALRRAQRMLLERAKQRYEAGRGAAGAEAGPHLEGALDALDLAHHLAPAPWLLFNMAQVRSQLGACSEAADLYHRFLASDPAPEAKRSAEKALELLGACEESSPVARAENGLAPALRIPSSVDAIFAGQGVTATPEPPASVTGEPAEENGVARALPWAFGSLSVISAVAGAVYWSEALDAKHDLDQIRIAGPDVAATQRRGESARDLARVFGGLSVGFALAAGASYLWLRPEREEAPLAATLERISWIPLVGGAGASYRSEF
jgi:hypothetical protein